MKGVCEDLIIKVDKLVFHADFVVLDMEGDPKIPIILGKPFLNTACAVVDMRESTHTLRVVDDLVTFVTNQEKEHKKSIEDKTSSMELSDELLEKELALLQEDNSKQYSLDEEFDAQGDLRELERLLEGVEDNFEEITSTLDEKNLKMRKKFKLMRIRMTRTLRLNPIYQEEKGDNLTTRTKHRTSVSTNFEVFTFKPPDSQAYEVSKEEVVTLSDDEMMMEKAIEIDKGGMDMMGNMVEERKKICGKRIKCKFEGNDTKMRKEELKKFFLRIYLSQSSSLFKMIA
uniref:Uncharacterized protein n=1 Tax=Lactuca sativa TaxID=4236 RepID=A0A9R1X010_LACSA|nr:hypothetical protein LSAT_V11C800433220 [Lactuca sativa]